MRYFVLLVFIVTPVLCMAQDNKYRDSTKQGFRDIGFEYDIGYLNIKTTRLSNYFGQFGYAPLTSDYVGSGFVISLGSDLSRISLGFQRTISVNEYDQPPAKYMNLDNFYYSAIVEQNLIKAGRFNLPFTFGFSEALTTLSLITNAQLPVSAIQAGTNVPGSTVLELNTYYIPLGLKPSFTLYRKPNWILYKMNISLDLKYYINIIPRNNTWGNQGNIAVSGMPANHFDSYYIGFVDLEWFLKR